MSNLFNKLTSLSLDGNESERKIANWLSQNKADISEISAISLGQLCGVSNASVVRFAQQLGYKGYPALKFDYLSELKKRTYQDQRSNLDENQSTVLALKKSSYIVTDNLSRTFEKQRPQSIEVSAEALFQAERIAILAQGSSSIVGSYISQKLIHADKAAWFQSDYALQQNYVTLLGGNDVALVLSVNGEAEEMILLAQAIKNNGCKMVAITGHEESKIAELADVILPFSYDEEHLLLSGATPQISQLAIFDIIFHQLLCLKRKQKDTNSLKNQELASKKLATL